MKTEMKPGVKTTEFWMLLGTGLVATALTHFQSADGTIATIVVALLTALYTILRSALKSKSAS